MGHQPKHNAYKTAMYDKQWVKTAKNKIKRIAENKGSQEVIEKYKVNPKWRGTKAPIKKGKSKYDTKVRGKESDGYC